MTDKFRRCEARDKDGPRCRLHVWHVRETNTSGGLEIQETKHRAFGREWE